VSGIKLAYHCSGTSVVIDGIWKAPDGPSGTLTPIGDSDTLRFVTNDFMYTGGDGYTEFAKGTDVLQTGDLLLNVAIDYIGDHSPVAPVVEGRVVRNADA
jgi:2',3'-cyclic-nucleotide 2'-phosphodiesterase (5'-nucleotidase family)